MCQISLHYLNICVIKESEQGDLLMLLTILECETNFICMSPCVTEESRSNSLFVCDVVMRIQPSMHASCARVTEKPWSREETCVWYSYEKCFPQHVLRVPEWLRNLDWTKLAGETITKNVVTHMCFFHVHVWLKNLYSSETYVWYNHEEFHCQHVPHLPWLYFQPQSRPTAPPPYTTNMDMAHYDRGYQQGNPHQFDRLAPGYGKNRI